jgi:chemotaxis protein histidine kinase CheA
MDITKIKIKAIAIFFFCCYALASCFSSKVKAENVITGNILPNAGNSVSSYNSGTTPVISDNTSDTTMSNNTTLDGFAITCDTANGQNGGCGAFFTYDKAVEAAHDLKITSTATLVGIAGTGQTSSDTITSTVDKLDNGITLDSTIDMQNCEWSGSAFRCGDSAGAADSYTVKIRILDSSDEELAAVTQTRTNDAGYYANSETFTNQLVYTGTGASKYEWSWNGVDGSGSTSTHANQRGPNLLGAKLLMTFDSEDYVRISTESQTALTSVATTFAELEETFAEAVSVIAEDPVTFSMEIEEETSFEETFSFEEEVFEEEVFEEPAVEEEVMEEEIYEEAEEVETSFVPTTSEEEEVVSEEEESFEESTMEPTQEEEAVAEEEETVAEEEEVASEEEEQVEEESTEVVEETNEEEAEETQEEESSSETATTSTVSSKKSAKQKKVRSKKSLMANMERMMDKVDEDVKDIAKNLALKNIIKMKAMASEQASLDLYKNAIFYKPKDIYLEQLNIFDNRQIYVNVSLASYIKTDKVAIKANALHEINLKKHRLLIELEQLKNGKI